MRRGGGAIEEVSLTPTEGILAFTLAAALMTLTPGLDTALVLRTAAVEGSGRAVLAGLGVCCGVLVWGLVAAAGLGAVLSASELAYTALRIAGACYLLYLGAVILRDARRRHRDVPPPVETSAPDRVSAAAPGQWFMRGLLTNLLNPKVGVFYVTFLPQFIPHGAPHGVGVFALGMLMALIHAVEGALWFGALVLATNSLASWIRRPRVAAALDYLTGGMLVLFGLKLAFEMRHLREQAARLLQPD
jgi:threonine/homoserine/homoserine lactone efflux protein